MYYDVQLFNLDDKVMFYTQLLHKPVEGEFISVNDNFFKVEKVVHSYRVNPSDGYKYSFYLNVFIRNMSEDESALYSQDNGEYMISANDLASLLKK